MPHHKSTTFLILTVCIIGTLMASCSTPVAQQPVYDTSKIYAAFLVLNSPNWTGALDDIKNISVADGFEIGPMEYYNAGTVDFEPILKKLTPSKQVTLIWVAGNIMDVPNIQKAISKVSFKGQIRYAKPIAGQAVPLGTQ
jgi:hypothetical protein